MFNIKSKAILNLTIMGIFCFLLNLSSIRVNAIELKLLDKDTSKEQNKLEIIVPQSIINFNTKLTNSTLTEIYNLTPIKLSNGIISDDKVFIEKKLINRNYTKNKTLNPKYIIIHDTGNRNIGANADMHYTYWTKPTSEKTSAHFVIDDSNIIQLLETSQVAWHTGKLFTKEPEVPTAVNENSIGVELCVNSDGDFMKTMKNGIDLTKYLMKKYNIPPENVITHNQATGKICPAMMIQDNPKLWNLFKNEIKENKSEQIIKSLSLP